MRITYDPEARAAYIFLVDDDDVWLTRDIDDRVIVDRNAEHRVVGIELLDVDMPVLELLGEEE